MKINTSDIIYSAYALNKLSSSISSFMQDYVENDIEHIYYLIIIRNLIGKYKSRKIYW